MYPALSGRLFALLHKGSTTASPHLPKPSIICLYSHLSAHLLLPKDREYMSDIDSLIQQAKTQPNTVEL